MKFFNDLYEQARLAFLAMPMGNRVIAIGLVSAVVLSLGFLVQGTSTSSGEYLFGGRALEESEINRAEFAFSQAQLRDWERVGNRLRVPSKNKDEYLRALSDANALPRELDWATQEAIKNFNVFEPNAQREDRLEFATRQNLQHAIESFSEVKSALVQVAVGKQGLRGAQPVSASVIVTPHASQTLSPQREDAIRNLVAASYPGLQADKVVVTDTNRQPGSANWIDSDDPYYRAKKQFEIDYHETLQSLLQPYGPLRLAVSVDVDPTLQSNSSILKYQGNPLTIAERATQKQSENVRPGPGGVPGVASNAYGNKGTSINPDRDQTSKTTETVEAADRVLGQEQTTVKSVGLTPKKIAVAIGVPESYIETIYRRDWLMQNPTKKPEEIPQLSAADRERLQANTTNTIQQTVSGILPPVPAGNDKFPLVNVFYYLDSPATNVETVAAMPGAMKWLSEYWQTLLLAGFALVSLLMIRSFVKSSPPTSSPEFENGFGLVLPELPKDELQIVGVAEDGTPIMEISGSNLKDQLSELIDNNPDAAANILRAWIEDDKDRAEVA